MNLLIKSVQESLFVRAPTNSPLQHCGVLSVPPAMHLHVNYTHLKIMGMENLKDISFRPAVQVHQPAEHVTTLELALMNTKESNDGRQIDFTKLRFLSHHLPNVSHLVLNRVPAKNANDLFNSLPNLHQVAWSGGILQLHGFDFYCTRGLTELMVDGCHFVSDRNGNMDDQREALLNEFSNNALGEDGDSYIFKHCRNLERLSMKNATWSTSTSHWALPPEPIPQEMIVKMVRHHPTLRWLKSDLSPENVAMLQQEKPNITFETE